MLYAGLRFMVEFLRAHLVDNPWGGPFSDDQWISLALFVAGAAIFAAARQSGAAKPAAKLEAHTRRGRR
jgi:prolipoprotein diacylglyceryltransferase